MMKNGSNTNIASRLQTCRQTTRKKLRELFDGIYNEYIVDIYQNAHSNALNDSWDKQNGWSGGLLLLAVGDDAAARAARRHALLVTLLRRRCSVVLLRDEKVVAAQKQRGCKWSTKSKRCCSSGAAVINHGVRRRHCSTLSRLRLD